MTKSLNVHPASDTVSDLTTHTTPSSNNCTPAISPHSVYVPAAVYISTAICTPSSQSQANCPPASGINLCSTNTPPQETSETNNPSETLSDQPSQGQLYTSYLLCDSPTVDRGPSLPRKTHAKRVLTSNELLKGLRYNPAFGIQTPFANDFYAGLNQRFLTYHSISEEI